jgi:general secretion pathway protein C
MTTQKFPFQSVRRQLSAGFTLIELMVVLVIIGVLAGVVAGSFRTGAALISVDGRAAKPVRVGSLVDDGVMLQSVTARSAVLSSGDGASANFTLELPSLDN